MNERIKRAWIDAVIEDSDPDKWDTQEEFLERFGKMIILECAAFIDSKLILTEHSYDSYDIVSCASGKDLKEHFGVEE